MQLQKECIRLAGRSRNQVPKLRRPWSSLVLGKVRTPKPAWRKVYVATYTRCVVGIGATHSIGLPIHIYALYENAFRAYRKQSIEQNNEESARLYAEFAKIAEQNEFAWNYGQEAPTAETISTVTAKNRMICFPCTLSLHHE